MFAMTVLTKARRAIDRNFDLQHRIASEMRDGEPELALLAALGDTDRDFLDIGANRGIYACVARPYFRKVHAVEAHPGLAASLRFHLGPGDEVHSFALSDREGEASFWIPVRASRLLALVGRGDVTSRSSLESGANPGFVLREVKVPVRTVDSLGLAELAVIKIDVEGHEFAVLNGARRTLATSRPVCIVEVEERHNRGGVARAFDFFASEGFDPWFVHRGRLRPGCEFSPEELQHPRHAKSFDGARSPDYVNNFIFVHRQSEACLDPIRDRLAAHA